MHAVELGYHGRAPVAAVPALNRFDQPTAHPGTNAVPADAQELRKLGRGVPAEDGLRPVYHPETRQQLFLRDDENRL
jgi:hypothetical protein